MSAGFLGLVVSLGSWPRLGTPESVAVLESASTAGWSTTHRPLVVPATQERREEGLDREMALEAQSDPMRISGVVVESGSHRPIDGASIVARRAVSRTLGGDVPRAIGPSLLIAETKSDALG